MSSTMLGALEYKTNIRWDPWHWRGNSGIMEKLFIPIIKIAHLYVPLSL